MLEWSVLCVFLICLSHISVIVETAEWIELVFSTEAILVLFYTVLKKVWISQETRVLPRGASSQSVVLFHHGVLTITNVGNIVDCFKSSYWSSTFVCNIMASMCSDTQWLRLVSFCLTNLHFQSYSGFARSTKTDLLRITGAVFQSLFVFLYPVTMWEALKGM